MEAITKAGLFVLSLRLFRIVRGYAWWRLNSIAYSIEAVISLRGRHSNHGVVRKYVSCFRHLIPDLSFTTFHQSPGLQLGLKLVNSQRDSFAIPYLGLFLGKTRHARQSHNQEA